MRSTLFIMTMAVMLLSGCSQNEWTSLFDGKSFQGWQASESDSSWKVEDGAIVTAGTRSHLFYMGDVSDHNFKNFEFSAEVMTAPGSNSGIYFHTEYQDEGWPAKGYEAQVINSNPPGAEGGYVEHKMTGSIYAVRNVWKAPARDNEWFTYRIEVRGKTIRTYINGDLIADYTEPDKPYRPEEFSGRLLSSGTFALQCHDPGSVVRYRNIRVRILPDDLPTPGTPLEDQDYNKKLIDLAAENFPLVDLHVHLKGGLTREVALANARRFGFSYGFAVNCGLGMGIETESALRAYADHYKQPPGTWFAMQAEGREWTDLFSDDVVSGFDYVFTDAMTWTNDNGKRMRLWIPEETEVGDPRDFMEQLVDRIEGILNDEPVDIYVNPTYLPDEIAGKYDQLWTPERMDRVIGALVDNGIALEINNSRKLPSPDFIRRAKDAGVKFTFGTNNAGAGDLGRMEYAIRMIGECGLTPDDIWMPPAD